MVRRNCVSAIQDYSLNFRYRIKRADFLVHLDMSSKYFFRLKICYFHNVIFHSETKHYTALAKSCLRFLWFYTHQEV